MSVFITGTGTGVGKTVVTAGLAALLQKQGKPFCVYKPIQTGSPDPAHPEDPEQIKAWLGLDVPTACTYTFPEPVAPYAADHHRTIDPLKLLFDLKRLQREHHTVLVEGAGGVRVPVARHFEMIDLIRMFQLPVIVVAGPYLGTINHTLLTLGELERQRVEVLGVVISGMPAQSGDPAVASLLETLEPFLPVPLLGALPVFDVHPGFLQRPEVISAFEKLDLANQH